MSEPSHKLVFATTNIHKVKEIRKICPSPWQIVSLEDLNYDTELEETGETLKQNALQKAQFISKTFQLDCFSEDTGLEIRAIGNEPGIHSARYAGTDRSSEANMKLVLQRMEGLVDRYAHFRTVIALVQNDNVFYFEGVTSGKILHHRRGEGGFGYDPIFQPDGFEKTFAEMTMREKSDLSHRSKAFKKLMLHLHK